MKTMEKIQFMSVICAVLIQFAAPDPVEVHFLNTPYEGRVYLGADPGEYVLTIEACEWIDGYCTDNPVSYYLYDQDDFSVGEESGEIHTLREVTKPISSRFRFFVVVVISSGTSQFHDVTVYVSHYNSVAPYFEQQVYDVGVFRVSSPGTYMMTLHAHDDDEQVYNKRLSYYITGGTYKDYFDLNATTGRLSMGQRLPALSETFELTAKVFDGGSPLKEAQATLNIYLSDISAPRRLEVLEVSVTEVYICWLEPLFGVYTSYMVTYYSLNDTRDRHEVNVDHDNRETCTTLRDMAAWETNVVMVRARNSIEIGPQSEEAIFVASGNGCGANPCWNGTCIDILEEPGYKCNCANGFYGYNCEMLNLCTTFPCQHDGTCANTSSNVYVCSCSELYWGKDCQLSNPCNSDPCENDGSCRNTSSTSYDCDCPNGYYGNRCESYNPCDEGVCQNGGSCSSPSSDTFECQCKEGYSGTICADFTPCESNPCQHDGFCMALEGTYACECPPGYIGQNCQEYDPCDARPCRNGGTCTYTAMADRMTCSCDVGYYGNTCEEVNRCILDEMCVHGKCSWDYDSAIHTCDCEPGWYTNDCSIYDSCYNEPCHNGGVCQDDGDFDYECRCPDGYQGDHCEVTRRECESTPCNNGGTCYDQLTGFSCACLPGFEGEDCGQVGVCDADTTSGPYGVFNWPATLHSTYYNLSCPFGSVSSRQEGKAHRWCNLNAVENSILWQEPIYDGCLQENSAEAAELAEEWRRQTQDAESLSAQEVTQAVDAMENVVRYAIRDEKVAESMMLVISNMMDVEADVMLQSHKDDGTASRIVQVVEQYCEEVQIPTTEKIKWSTANLQVEAMDATGTGDDVEFRPAGENGRKVKDARCAFWNESESKWSTDGLRVDDSNDDVTSCLSSHMTSFALLMEPDPGTKISKKHQDILSVVSLVGCGLSIAGLVLTLLTYTLFKYVRNDRAGKILVNLCLALLFLNIFFILSSEGDDFSDAGCKTVAAMTHYFLLASFLWMLVEAFNLYQMLITVFISYESHFLIKRGLFAWGTPLIVVGIILAVDTSYYMSGEGYCRITHDDPYVYYISWLGFICLIIFLNTIIFFLVIRVVLKPRLATPQDTGDPKVNSAQVRGTFTIAFLLGVTWIFGAFAIRDAKLVFEYLFCICNALQGFLIFILRCVLHHEARGSWANFWRTGQLKQSPSSSGIISGSSSSSEPSLTHGNEGRGGKNRGFEDVFTSSTVITTGTETGTWGKKRVDGKSSKKRSTVSRYGEPEVHFEDTLERRRENCRNETGQSGSTSGVEIIHGRTLTEL